MGKKLVFLHTVPSLVEGFNRLAKELLPQGTEVVHIADEMLLKVVLANGGLTPFVYRRVMDHVAAAEEIGASAVQFTCSSISPCADVSRALVSIPVLKVDEPMVEQAIKLGTKIGIAATAPTTLKPTSDLVQKCAELAGKPVSIDAVLCEGAYAALFSGDADTHDRIVRSTLIDMMARNDVVVLAQASMARVLDAIPESERTAPVLASPRLAVEKAAQVLQG